MKRLANKTKAVMSVQRLVRAALRHWDTDQGWNAITELQMRGSEKMLAMAEALTRSVNWRRRGLGLYIAGQLRRREKSSSAEYAVEQTQRLLLAALHDKHTEVVRAAVSGLGHRPHAEAVSRLVELSAHGDGGLRFDVAVSLGRYQEPAATDALLRLMADLDDDVRDWATFGIGSMQKSDSPEIRAALWKNLRDKCEDVRGEALMGLAERRDERVAGYLLSHLGPDCRVYELDAAEKLGDPCLAKALQTLSDALTDKERSGYWYDCLQGAIEACRGSGAPAGSSCSCH